MSTPDLFVRPDVKPTLPHVDFCSANYAPADRDLRSALIVPVYQSAEKRQQAIALARIAEKDKVEKGKVRSLQPLRYELYETLIL